MFKYLVPGLLSCILLLALATSPAAADTRRLLNCDLDDTDIDQCDTTGYAIRVVTYFVPGCIVAVLILLTCPFFFVARFCCHCCGGSRPNSGCCCETDEPAVYSTADIVRPKIYAFLLIGLGLGFGVWGIIASGLTVAGVNGLADEIDKTPPRLENHLQRIQAALTVRLYDPTSDTFVTTDLFTESGLKDTAENAKRDIEDGIHDYISPYRRYVSDFSALMFIVFILPFLAAILGFIASICNIHNCLPMTLVFIMFFMSALMWAGHGLFSGMGIIVGDMCSEIRGLSKDQKTVLKPVVSCNDGLFVDFMNQFRNAESQVAFQTCQSINAVCYQNSQTALQNAQQGRIFDCPNDSVACSESMRFGDIVGYLNSDVVVDPRVQSIPGASQFGFTCRNSSLRCTPAACATNCVDSSGALSVSGRTARALVVAADSAYQVATALDTLGGDYGSCDAVLQLALVPMDDSCHKAAVGTVGMRQAAGLGGICCVLFIFVMTWGSKRFISLSSRRDVPH